MGPFKYSVAVAVLLLASLDKRVESASLRTTGEQRKLEPTMAALQAKMKAEAEAFEAEFEAEQKQLMEKELAEERARQQEELEEIEAEMPLMDFDEEYEELRAEEEEFSEYVEHIRRKLLGTNQELEVRNDRRILVDGKVYDPKHFQLHD